MSGLLNINNARNLRSRIPIGQRDFSQPLFAPVSYGKAPSLDVLDQALEAQAMQAAQAGQDIARDISHSQEREQSVLDWIFGSLSKPLDVVYNVGEAIGEGLSGDFGDAGRAFGRAVGSAVPFSETILDTLGLDDEVDDWLNPRTGIGTRDPLNDAFGSDIRARDIAAEVGSLMGERRTNTDVSGDILSEFAWNHKDGSVLQDVLTVGATIAEMFLDPVNYLLPGAGAAAKASKAGRVLLSNAEKVAMRQATKQMPELLDILKTRGLPIEAADDLVGLPTRLAGEAPERISRVTNELANRKEQGLLDLFNPEVTSVTEQARLFRETFTGADNPVLRSLNDVERASLATGAKSLLPGTSMARQHELGQRTLFGGPYGRILRALPGSERAETSIFQGLSKLNAILGAGSSIAKDPDVTLRAFRLGEISKEHAAKRLAGQLGLDLNKSVGFKERLALVAAVTGLGYAAGDVPGAILGAVLGVTVSKQGFGALGERYRKAVIQDENTAQVAQAALTLPAARSSVSTAAREGMHASYDVLERNVERLRSEGVYADQEINDILIREIEIGRLAGLSDDIAKHERSRLAGELNAELNSAYDALAKRADDRAQRGDLEKATAPERARITSLQNALSRLDGNAPVNDLIGETATSYADAAAMLRDIAAANGRPIADAGIHLGYYGRRESSQFAQYQLENPWIKRLLGREDMEAGRTAKGRTIEQAEQRFREQFLERVQKRFGKGQRDTVEEQLRGVPLYERDLVQNLKGAQAQLEHSIVRGHLVNETVRAGIPAAKAEEIAAQTVQLTEQLLSGFQSEIKRGADMAGAATTPAARSVANREVSEALTRVGVSEEKATPRVERFSSMGKQAQAAVHGSARKNRTVAKGKGTLDGIGRDIRKVYKEALGKVKGLRDETPADDLTNQRLFGATSAKGGRKVRNGSRTKRKKVGEYQVVSKGKVMAVDEDLTKQLAAMFKSLAKAMADRKLSRYPEDMAFSFFDALGSPEAASWVRENLQEFFSSNQGREIFQQIKGDTSFLQRVALDALELSEQMLSTRSEARNTVLWREGNIADELRKAGYSSVKEAEKDARLLQDLGGEAVTGLRQPAAPNAPSATNLGVDAEAAKPLVAAAAEREAAASALAQLRDQLRKQTATGADGTDGMSAIERAQRSLEAADQKLFEAMNGLPLRFQGNAPAADVLNALPKKVRLEYVRAWLNRQGIAAPDAHISGLDLAATTKAGIPEDVGSMIQMALSPLALDASEDFSGLLQRMKDMQKAPSGILKASDRVNGWFRSWFLSMPTSIANDILGNFTTFSLLGGYRAGDIKAGIRAYGRIAPTELEGVGRQLRKIGAKADDPLVETAQGARRESEIIDDARRYGAFHIEEGVTQAFAQGAQDIPETMLGRLATGQTKPQRAAMQLREAQDNAFRAAVILSEVKKGRSIQDAVGQARFYFFNYADVTQFENNTLRRLFLFYTFARKAVPLALRSSIERPMRFKTLALLTGMNTRDQDNPDLPQWARRLPGHHLAQTASGIPIFGSLPGSVLSPASEMLEGNVIENLLRSTNPLIRSMAEAGTDRDFFTGQPIGFREENQGEVLAGRAADRAPAWMNALPQTVKTAIGFTPKVNRRTGEVMTYEVDPRLRWVFETAMPFGMLSRNVELMANVLANVDERKERWMSAAAFGGVGVRTVPQATPDETMLQHIRTARRSVESAIKSLPGKPLTLANGSVSPNTRTPAGLRLREELDAMEKRARELAKEYGVSSRDLIANQKVLMFRQLYPDFAGAAETLERLRDAERWIDDPEAFKRGFAAKRVLPSEQETQTANAMQAMGLE